VEEPDADADADTIVEDTEAAAADGVRDDDAAPGLHDWAPPFQNSENRVMGERQTPLPIREPRLPITKP
jgi:hypothetical protein